MKTAFRRGEKQPESTVLLVLHVEAKTVSLFGLRREKQVEHGVDNADLLLTQSGI